ncbi:MAG: DinB family protein [Candidatus Thorarchaeota archaeon]
MVFKSLAEYQYWANHRIRDLILDMKKDEYEQEVAGRSIKGISSHIVGALATCFLILEKSSDRSIYDWIQTADRAELLLRWKELDDKLSRTIQQIPQGQITVSHVSEVPICIDIMDFLLQYVLHTNHHRGQLGLIIRELGYDVPGTDYLHYFAAQH